MIGDSALTVEPTPIVLLTVFLISFSLVVDYVVEVCYLPRAVPASASDDKNGEFQAVRMLRGNHMQGEAVPVRHGRLAA